MVRSIRQYIKLRKKNKNREKIKMELLNKVALPIIPNGMEIKTRYAQMEIEKHMNESARPMRSESIIVWPLLKCELNEIEKKYREIVDRYKSANKSDYYASLLALKRILLDNIQTGENDYFMDKKEVFNRYLENEQKMDKYIKDTKIVPTVKPEHIQDFNNRVLKKYLNKTECKPQDQRVNILHDVVLSILIKMINKNPEMLSNITTVEEIEYWSHSSKSDTLINANITPELLDKILIESSSTVKALIDKLMNVTNERKPENKAEKESLWCPETVVKFMENFYVADNKDWISTNEIYNHYLKWIPKDSKYIPTCTVFSAAIPKNLYSPKRRALAGYLVRLKT